MTPETISARLTSQIVGHPVRVFQEVTSTNDVAAQLGIDGAPEGFAIFAETQTAGRGRLGRQWQSARGQSLAFSILLRPRFPDISRIGLAIAVALARVLERLTTQSVGIKWPNDIYLGGKKIAGILCETGSSFVVVGIGLNISQTAEDFPRELADRAGSVAMFADIPPDRTIIAASILNELDRVYLSLPESFAEIIAECEHRSVLLEKPIEVELGNNRIAGVVTGLDSAGRLKIRLASGAESVVSAGEVTLLKV